MKAARTPRATAPLASVIAALCAGIALTALPVAAHAGDVQCLWDHLPKAEQDGYVNDYVATAGHPTFQAGDDSVGAAAQACSMTDKDAAAIGSAFGALELRLGAAAFLERNKHVSEVSMASAFMGQPEADRARFIKDVANGKDLPEDELPFLRDFSERLATTLGIKDDEEASGQMLIYFLAMVHQAQAETKF
jgi:hypothetical protein